jgi:hypothetical protein
MRISPRRGILWFSRPWGPRWTCMATAGTSELRQPCEGLAPALWASASAQETSQPRVKKQAPAFLVPAGRHPCLEHSLSRPHRSAHGPGAVLPGRSGQQPVPCPANGPLPYPSSQLSGDTAWDVHSQVGPIRHGRCPRPGASRYRPKRQAQQVPCPLRAHGSGGSPALPPDGYPEGASSPRIHLLVARQRPMPPGHSSREVNE